MGFVKDVAQSGVFGLAGLAGSALSKKKPASLVAPQPTMYSNTPYSKPMSMIGPTVGGN